MSGPPPPPPPGGPILVSTVPTNQATGIVLNSPVELIFDKDVLATGGVILIVTASTNAVLETIFAANTTLVAINNNQVTIDPSLMVQATAYYIIITPDAFTDVVGLPYAGLLTSAGFGFTTGGTAPPAPAPPPRVMFKNINKNINCGKLTLGNALLTPNENIDIVSSDPSVKILVNGKEPASAAEGHLTMAEIHADTTPWTAPQDFEAGLQLGVGPFKNITNTAVDVEINGKLPTSLAEVHADTSPWTGIQDFNLGLKLGAVAKDITNTAGDVEINGKLPTDVATVHADTTPWTDLQDFSGSLNASGTEAGKEAQGPSPAGDANAAIFCDNSTRHSGGVSCARLVVAAAGGIEGLISAILSEDDGTVVGGRSVNAMISGEFYLGDPVDNTERDVTHSGDNTHLGDNTFGKALPSDGGVGRSIHYGQVYFHDSSTSGDAAVPSETLCRTATNKLKHYNPDAISHDWTGTNTFGTAGVGGGVGSSIHWGQVYFEDSSTSGDAAVPGETLCRTATNKLKHYDPDATTHLWTNTNTFSGTLNIVAKTAPASASATGVAGTVIIDADYIYRCTATNTWKRSPLSTW